MQNFNIMATKNIINDTRYEIAKDLLASVRDLHTMTDVDKLNVIDSCVISAEMLLERLALDKPTEVEIPKRGRKPKSETFDPRTDLSYVDPKYLKLWNAWLDYKDEINKQYKTQRGIESMYKSLVKYSNDNIILAHAIVMNAIEKSYDGFYGLTDKQVEFFLSNNSPYIDGVKEFADIEQPKQETKPSKGGWNFQ